MRIQTGQLVSLGYGRYVRSDEVVAVEPITEGRGPGRRCLVYVRGVPDPFVASRAQASIIADLMRPTEPVRGAPEPTARPRAARRHAESKPRPVAVKAKRKPAAPKARRR
jgi:hypothetical protein